MQITATDVNNALVSSLAIRTLANKYKSLIAILTYGNQYPTVEDNIVNVAKDQSLFQERIETKDQVALSEDVLFVYETLDNSSNIKSTMTVLSRNI
ncbi:hypothetical protein O181_031208 [Austropuccinia psidii MF-1]|uniref:Uncharacterized protein n=1 Tax=Austropuccinia psidii MF-1 TaxID=1389203 RepID=A0A9Q3CX03_9BASI|nr:hypothetical protein [Austropuccinia psidii MF-1]